MPDSSDMAHKLNTNSKQQQLGKSSAGSVVEDEDDHGERMLKMIEEIDPSILKSMKHSKFIGQLVHVIQKSIGHDSVHLFLFLDAIKNCPSPGYKRDTLIEVLSILIGSHDSSILNKIFSQPFRSDSNRMAAWKDLANAIATLPDLLANFDVLEKFSIFRKEKYYDVLITQLFTSLEILASNVDSNQLSEMHKMFLLQLIGRIAISGHSQLVWRKFTSKAMCDDQPPRLKQLVSSILSPPINSPSVQDSTMIEVFADHLYMPIFYNAQPRKQTGDLIKSILGDCVLTHDYLQFIICDKSILKANYMLKRHQQEILLHNIFAYLSSLVNNVQCLEQKPMMDNVSDERHRCSILVSTLLEIVHNWSNGTRVLLRVYEHNRYITCALLIAFKYCMAYDKQSLANCANKIQSMIIGAIPTYLNRASCEQRNLAMCLSKLIVPKLHELIMEQSGRLFDEKGNKRDINLEFNVDFNDDLCQIQRLFEQDIDELYLDSRHKDSLASDASHGALIDCIDATSRDNNAESSQHSHKFQIGQDCCNSKSNDLVSGKHQSVAENNDDGDDEEDDDEEEDILDSVGYSQVSGVPMYLHDCINGLIENNNARYVKLCLSKLGELLDRMLDQQQAQYEKALRSTYNRAEQVSCGNYAQVLRQTKEADVNVTIRDVAIELAQVLLYLDDQFKIKNFPGQRLKCLTLLCVAAPDLVAKYLLEQFNESSRGLMRQLDILQVLVASAHHLAGMSSINALSIGNMYMGKNDDDDDDDVEPGYETSATKTTMNNDFQDGKQPERMRRMSGVVELARRSANRTPAKVSESSGTVRDIRGGGRLAPKINQFARHASLYFYGIVHWLKADLNEESAIKISQPKEILPEIRRLRDHQQVGSANCILIAHGSGTEDRRKVDDFFINDVDTSNDNSYLHSRILFSISLIIRCLNQQMITCRLADDLLDILAAFRCHPDAGVQKGLISCLKSVRDCTPSVYFAENIEKRMLHLFSPWLSNQLETYVG